jgi:hypothetical protein
MSYEAYPLRLARLRENGLTTQPADSKSARETAVTDHETRGVVSGRCGTPQPPSASNRTDTPPASARCDVAVNGLCRVHESLDCRAVKDALLAERTKERDELKESDTKFRVAWDKAVIERDEAREALGRLVAQIERLKKGGPANVSLPSCSEARQVLSKAEGP